MDVSSVDEAAPFAHDPKSDPWVTRLSATGRQRDEAMAELHALLLRVARSQVNQRAARFHVTGPEVDDVAHQATDDALVAIMGKLADFRGESRFTTWACKFVLLEVANKLGRHFWRHVPASDEDGSLLDRLPDRFGLDPAREAEWRGMVSSLRRAVGTSLTDYQRTLFDAIVLRGVPLDALVVQLGSSRNAIYKGLFDARRKLRACLVADGYLEPNDQRRRS